MTRALMNRSKKAGLPPGTLVHIGQQKLAVQRISVVEYDENRVDEYEVDDIQQQCATLKEKPGVAWINVDGSTRRKN
jgi:magnesium transporter